jgi:hypothetical protein
MDLGQADVFLSYNTADRAAVEGVAIRLRAAHIEPWIDSWKLAGGGRWQEEIAKELWRVKACAVCVGSAGLGDWAKEELAVAQDRAAKDGSFRLFMVLLPGAPDPLDSNLAFLRTRSWVDLRRRLEDPAGIGDLIGAITGVPRGGATAIGTAVRPDGRPEAFEDDVRGSPPSNNPQLDLSILGTYAAGHDLNIGQVHIHEAERPWQVPAQLPRDIDDFTGRGDALDESLAVLDREPATVGKTIVAPVLAAYGKPGVGKTTFAVRLGHRLANRFPDGQLFVSLRGVEVERLDPAVVLADFLDAMGVTPASVPASLDARAGLYRARLAGRRVLVVLDNAAEEAQVRPLLPGAPWCG